MGRKVVHSREGSEFKVAMGVFWSWKFTWERAWIKVSAGWPKSQRKKDGKHQFQTRGSCNQRPERESERGWSGGERGGKGGNESEGLLSLHPSCICGGRERSARWNLRKCLECEQTKTKVLWLNRFNCICCPFWAMSLWTAGHWILSLLICLFSHHAWFFCNLSIKSGMRPACSSDETMLFIWRPWKLNLRRYLSWLSVLLDKQQNNVQASPWLQLTTFQLRDNLVPSEDNVIALEQTPNVCGWPEAARQNMSFFFF